MSAKSWGAKVMPVVRPSKDMEMAWGPDRCKEQERGFIELPVKRQVQAEWGISQRGSEAIRNRGATFHAHVFSPWVTEDTILTFGFQQRLR